MEGRDMGRRNAARRPGDGPHCTYIPHAVSDTSFEEQDIDIRTKTTVLGVESNPHSSIPGNKVIVWPGGKVEKARSAVVHQVTMKSSGHINREWE
jgi:hypothetical protein